MLSVVNQERERELEEYQGSVQNQLAKGCSGSNASKGKAIRKLGSQSVENMEQKKDTGSVLGA